MQEDIIKGRDDGLGGRYKIKGIVQEEDFVKGKDDAQGGQYKREG